MSYLGNGLGAIESSHWKMVSGIAKPMDFGTLGIFKDLQLQTNRLASKFKDSLVAVDGAIGPGTLALVKKQGNHIFYATAMRLTTVDELAGVADEVARQFRSVADGSGIPATIKPPASGGGGGGGVVFSPPPSLPPALPGTGLLAPLAPLASGFPGGMTGLLLVGGALVLAVAQKKGWLRRKGKLSRAMARAKRRR